MFLSLLSLVPAEFHEWPLGAWDIGEQEAALTGLVKAITDSDTVTSDFDRAQIAVLAERWDYWASLQGALAECPRDAHAPQSLAIIEGTPEGTRVNASIARQMAGDNPWPGCTAVAWIACRRCEEVLARIHEIVQPWNYPGNLTSAYVILPSRATFSTGAAALAALTEAHQHP
jgi:hypothetical protein